MPAMGGKEYKKKMEERRAAKPAKVASVRPTGPAVRLGGKEKKAQLEERRSLRGKNPGRVTIMPVPPKPSDRKIGRPVPPKKRG